MTNKLTYTRKEVQPKYINEEAREEVREDLKYIESFINTEIRNALRQEGLDFDLKTVIQLTGSSDAIRAMIEKQRDKYIASLGFIPITEKQRIILAYEDVISRLLPVNTRLYNEVKKYRLTLIQEKDKSIRFDQKEVDDYCNSLGVRCFNNIELEYIETLQQAAELLCKAQHMEIDNSFEPYALGIIKFIGNQFYTDCLSRDISNKVDIINKLVSKSTLKITTQLNNETHENY